LGWFKNKIDNALSGFRKNDIYSKGYLNMAETLAATKMPYEDRKFIVDDEFRINRDLRKSKKPDNDRLKYNQGAIQAIMDVKKLMNEHGMNLYARKKTDSAKYPKDLDATYISKSRYSIYLKRK
jgi:hypothetical protein